jgi:hypothetical protein
VSIRSVRFIGVLAFNLTLSQSDIFLLFSRRGTFRRKQKQGEVKIQQGGFGIRPYSQLCRYLTLSLLDVLLLFRKKRDISAPLKPCEVKDKGRVLNSPPLQPTTYNLLLHQHHFLRLHEVSRLQSVEIHAA